MKQNHFLKKLLTAAFLSWIVVAALAQENQRKTKGEVPLQITFITPMGTNGLASSEISNKLSFNMLIGVNGGLSGVELGGLINVITGSADGVQLAGLGNYVHREVSGAQFGGLFNVTRDTFKGAQFGGLTNISLHDASGVQFAGLANVVHTNFKGFQGAGLINIVTGETDGTQIGGLVNYSGKNAASGQIAGLVSIAGGKAEKIQMSGLVNIAAAHARGGQIAGIVNYTHRLDGVQIGLINIADSIGKGVAIGLINYARNGYMSIGALTDETFRGGLTFKMGLKELYSIIHIGYTEGPYWGVGCGMGTFLVKGNKIDLALEGTSYQINEDEWWTDETNMLVRLNLNLQYHLSPRLSLVAGASDNLAVSQLKDAEGRLTGGTFIPGTTFFDHTGKKTRTVMYPGVSLGVLYQIR